MTTNRKDKLKVPKRIVPLRRGRDRSRTVIGIVIQILFFLVFLYFIFQNRQPGEQGISIFVWLLVLICFGGIVTWIFLPGGLISQLLSSRALLAGSAKTSAQIVKLWGVEHLFGKDEYTPNVTYHLLVEFTPSQAIPSVGLQQFEAIVSKRFYDTLSKPYEVQVTYAIQNPRIFFIEGE